MASTVKPAEQMSPRQRIASRAIIAMAGMLVAGACQSDGNPVKDAGPDAALARDASGDDAARTVLSVDFTVTGCPGLDLDKPQCQGSAPLTLSFVPLTSGPVTRFYWDFGDLSKSAERTPSHTFTLPGTYSVSLTGVGPTGEPVAQRHMSFVVVAANALGGPCDVDRQCAPGLRCVCGSAAAGCPSAFVRGLCAGTCGADGSCPAGAICAAPGGEQPVPPSPGMSTGGASWGGPLCLASCEKDEDCSQGRHCRQIPTPGLPRRWVRACFPAFPADVGESCRSGNDELQNDRCLTGTCSDLGALGLCTAACATTADCPAGAACATFGDGRRLCVRACADAVTCQSDPLLTCVPPGAPGALGFTTDRSSPGVTYCAPRPCQTSAECGSTGVCSTDAGHCLFRRSP